MTCLLTMPWERRPRATRGWAFTFHRPENTRPAPYACTPLSALPLQYFRDALLSLIKSSLRRKTTRERGLLCCPDGLRNAGVFRPHHGSARSRGTQFIGKDGQFSIALNQSLAYAGQRRQISLGLIIGQKLLRLFEPAQKLPCGLFAAGVGLRNRPDLTTQRRNRLISSLRHRHRHNPVIHIIVHIIGF